jgi:hypothetical protein
VRTFGADGKDGGVSFTANGTPRSGVNVAVGDVTGDGVPEIVTGTGPGIQAQVQVWSRDGKTLVAQTNPFSGFDGGVNVAVANIDDTAALEVIVAAGPGGGPHVMALRLLAGQLSEAFGFYAYGTSFTGGVYVGGAPGKIITGAGAGGGPHVRVWSIQSGQPVLASEWMAYGTDFLGGVRVAAGQVRTDAVDVVTGAGPAPGAGSHVKLWSVDGVEGPGIMAYDAAFHGGVYVAVGNGKRLITGAGAGGGPHVRVFTFANQAFAKGASFFAYAAEFTGGVRVAGFPLTPAAPTTTTTTAACDGTELPGVGCVPIGGASSDSTTTTAKPATTTTVKPTTTTAAPSTTTTVAPTTTTAAPTTTTTAGPTTSTTAAPCTGVPPVCLP